MIIYVDHGEEMSFVQRTEFFIAQRLVVDVPRTTNRISVSFIARPRGGLRPALDNKPSQSELRQVDPLSALWRHKVVEPYFDVATGVAGKHYGPIWFRQVSEEVYPNPLCVVLTTTTTTATTA